MARASGLVSSTDRSAGPLPSISSMRLKQASAMERVVHAPLARPSCRSAIVVSASGKSSVAAEVNWRAVAGTAIPPAPDDSVAASAPATPDTRRKSRRDKPSPAFAGRGVRSPNRVPSVMGRFRSLSPSPPRRPPGCIQPHYPTAHCCNSRQSFREAPSAVSRVAVRRHGSGAGRGGPVRRGRAAGRYRHASKRSIASTPPRTASVCAGIAPAKRHVRRASKLASSARNVSGVTCPPCSAVCRRASVITSACRAERPASVTDGRSRGCRAPSHATTQTSAA